MSDSHDKHVFVPEASDFTFSTSTVPNAPTPNFEPRSMFYYNIPQVEKDQRDWVALPHQMRMRETLAPPVEDPVPDPTELASRPIARPRGKKMSAKNGSKEVEEKSAERLAKENAFLAEQLKRERAKFLALKEDLREEQITKQAALNQLQKEADDAEERARKHKKAFEGQQHIVTRQEKQVQILLQNHDILLGQVHQKMTEENSKTGQQEIIIKELQTKNEALQKIVEENPEIEQHKAAIEELQGKNEALQKLVQDNSKIEQQEAVIEELQGKNEALQKLVEDNSKIEQQQAVIEELQGKNEALQKLAEDSLKIEQQKAVIEELQGKNEALQKLAEDNPKIEQQKVAIKELETKNDTLQKMLETQPIASIEGLQNTIHKLEKEKEALKKEREHLKEENENFNTESDAKVTELEESREREHNVSVAFRHASTALESRDIIIQRLEEQLGQSDERLRDFEKDRLAREARLGGKDADLKVARAEIGNLNTLNTQLTRENLRLKSQSEKLTKILQEDHAEIERLQAANEELKDIEGKLAEVTTAAALVKTELMSMEEINRTLKLKIGEGRQFYCRAGKADNLEHELLDSYFESISSDDDAESQDGSTGLITSIGRNTSLQATSSAGNSPGKITPQYVQDIDDPEGMFNPQNITSGSSTFPATGVKASPKIATSKNSVHSSDGKVVAFAPAITQSPVDIVATTIPGVPTHQELTQIPVTPAASTSPEVTTFPNLTQTPAATVASITPTRHELTHIRPTTMTAITPEVDTSPNIKLSPVVTAHTTATVETLPGIILKHHNPLKCWLQVYRDLWSLFFFCLSICWETIRQGIIIVCEVLPVRPPGSYIIPSSSHDQPDNVEDTARVEGGPTIVALKATLVHDDSSMAATTSISTKSEKVKKELPGVWITVSAFIVHVCFYTLIILCISNYGSLLHERSIWLLANDVTRQYFQDIYKIPFKPDHSISRQLFGPVIFFDNLQFYVHSWIKISRSLPG